MFSSAIAGFVASAVLIIAIGAQNAFVLRQGLRREHVLPVVLTCALSDLALISAGIAGFGAVLNTHPGLITAIRWAGAVFLLGYAILAARRALRPSSLEATAKAPTTLRATLLTCLALTYLNPHVYLDTVLLLGSVAQQHQDRWAFGLGAAFASLSWFFSLGLGARWLAPLLARPSAWRVLDASIAVVMTVLGVALIVQA
ncbi:LysE/ArgO family amino acid transporter [Actinoplanes derwentensis]|uniref:L-lysine exporter family protein LysE/ArgO n=1 Tax=Actinoplanes derwentensis TaxID=113562 RepID=A0A1H2D1W4_9ACTN|nr:LysE/ArgO family amino acid transporter [Actinoplanes derwentensis]GID86838.1 amino acid transporter [Actinoplanes derwentensis]SDT76750.1 L-lysine exporter family protein LysE/ArgO [Actinoplanes derwentensis]